MLVSALLTSVGINSGLCVLFFVLHSILRKQPGYYEVYIPRLLAGGGDSSRRSRFNLDRLIPSPGWVSRAWRLSEDELLSSSGLDAVVFMRVITFSLKVFTFAGVIGIFVLLPVNSSGTALDQLDFADLTNNSLDVFSISNVGSGSKWLWVHFAAIYAMTIFVCCLLYYEYRYIASKRIEFFYSSKPRPHHFTILVRGIPVSAGASVSDSVESFFMENHPTTYLSHIVVRRTNKLRKLIHEARNLYTRIIHLQSDSAQQKYRRLGFFRQKVDAMDHYEKELEDLEENVRLEQSEASMVEDSRAAFVSFKSRYAAATACHLRQATNPTRWVTEQAHAPDDVFWPFFSSSFIRRWISKLLVIVACILLTVLFLLPVILVQGLTNLSQLEIIFPFLKSILSLKFASGIVTGYLPSLILMLFLKIVPPVMFFLSSIHGYTSLSDIEKSACNKVLWFTIWNIFFATVFSGSVLYQLSIILEPTNIPAKLAIAVPAQASFFIAYVVTSGWTSTASELFRIIPFICTSMARCCCCCSRNTDDDTEVPSIPYHRDLPRMLFLGLLGITYFFQAPLILPFLLIYLCLAYVVFRNQFINVYAPRNETAGKYWPIVHNSMIFSLLLMHAIAVGIFTLKKLSLASTLIFPLAILTLLFNEYCRKRFLPIFVAYSAEVLIKKDKEEQEDSRMTEFFNDLVTAYQDPALMPIQYSSHTDGIGSPLLSLPPV